MCVLFTTFWLLQRSSSNASDELQRTTAIITSVTRGDDQSTTTHRVVVDTGILCRLTFKIIGHN